MQNEVFHFLCCVQAPLGTGEVFRLLAMTLNLVEGGQRGGDEAGAAGLETTGASTPTQRPFWRLRKKLATKQ